MRMTGVDEAGVGPLAGPLMVAAVTLTVPDDFDFTAPREWWPVLQVNDSKKLSRLQKLDAHDRLYEYFLGWGAQTCVAAAEVAQINSIGHAKAYTSALLRATDGARAPVSDWIVMDGKNPIPFMACPQRAVPQADSKYFAVAAASILAKVAHDDAMLRLDEEFPEYGFRNHMGYGTPEHIAALRKYGPTPHHRTKACATALGKPEATAHVRVRGPRR